MTSLFEWLCIHWGLHKGRTWSGSYIIYARAAVRYGRASLAGASGHVDRAATRSARGHHAESFSCHKTIIKQKGKKAGVLTCKPISTVP